MGKRARSLLVEMPDGSMGKVCKTCGAARSFAEFSPHRACVGGVRSECKVCSARYTSRWRSENPERNNAAVARWHANHPERVREIGTRWRRANGQRLREYRQRRCAIVRGAAIAGRAIQRVDIWKRDGGKCHICGKACDPRNWHLDHLIPVSRGGTHTEDNVAVSHPRCNQSRGARGPAQLRLSEVPA